MVSSWTEAVRHMSDVAMGWGSQTGVMDSFLASILEWINGHYRLYFDGVRPLCYFGDLCSKNVMIHNGTFSGLVDLDSLAYGDYLEAIGRIKASWYGTHYGAVYCEAVMDEEDLDAAQRKLVTMYALLNRIYWACENGIQFNSNTRPGVDWERARKDKQTIHSLLEELEST